MTEAWKTLFHPFANGAVDAPQAGRWLFLGAEPGFRPPQDFGADLHLVQGFRSHFRGLEAAGHSVSPTPEGDAFDGALVLAGRYRGRNEAWIAQVLESVVPGGLILVAGCNDDGIGGLRKRMGKLVELDGRLPKYHGVVFWFRRPVDVSGIVQKLRPAPVRVEGSFATAPGMFSHDRVDTGSRLLAECLPEDWTGLAADFGAGWGYLSAMLASKAAAPASIDVYEADRDSLEAARENLASLAQPPSFDFFWLDLVGEEVDRKYDLVVMNPPFHQSRAAEPAIGQAMIAKASAALKPGGRLLMVANRGLPYEQVLKTEFRESRELRDEDGFRVIDARR